MTARLTDLYTTYAPLVFRRCKAVLRNEDEAWDGVQEIFLPGEIELKMRQRRLAEGIPLPAVTLNELKNEGELCGIAYDLEPC